MANLPVIRTTDLKMYFDIGRSFYGKTREKLHAVDGISLEVFPGETIGVVGESGCGKSTLGKTMLRLLEPPAGQIEFRNNGEYLDITNLREKELRPLRGKMNMVFQDPFSSLNPRKTVLFIVGEPLIVQNRLKGRALSNKVGELLEMVGLDANLMERFPHAFSGGQRQRIALARSLATEPTFLVADEPVSALDVSIQSQIINLFLELQVKMDLACIFISHDIKTVRHVSDRMAVMYLGQIVESGPPDEICREPKHPYCEALLSAVPIPEVSLTKKRIILKGDLPNPVNPPNGCRFHTRCMYKTGICEEDTPTLRLVEGSESHFVACHYGDTLKLAGTDA